MYINSTMHHNVSVVCLVYVFQEFDHSTIRQHKTGRWEQDFQINHFRVVLIWHEDKSLWHATFEEVCAWCGAVLEDTAEVLYVATLFDINMIFCFLIVQN